MCCPLTCLVHSSLSCTWMCLVYSSLCCFWTFLFYSRLCCPWMCLFHCSLCCPCTCLFTKDCALSIDMSSLQQPVLHLDGSGLWLSGAVPGRVSSTAASAASLSCTQSEEYSVLDTDSDPGILLNWDPNFQFKKIIKTPYLPS
jgi:hypothetical protein